MKRYAGSFVVALLVHAAVLFGIRLRATQAVPLAPGEQMEVSLVSAATDVAPAVNENPSPEPAPPEPQPEATPEPTPEPTMPEPESSPPPEPTRQAVPKPVEKPHAVTPRKSPARAIRTNTRGNETGTARPGATMIGASRPRYRYNPQPQYPAAAKAQKQQGRVILEVEVNASGHPTSVRLKTSSGFPLLDQSALEAVRRWEFEPGTIGGIPAASRVEIPVRFSLSN